jgi:biopolymer transport protein ExbD
VQECAVEKVNEKDMKKAFPATRRSQKSLSKKAEHIDLDVTPYMNLFMALLPLLIGMAVFTHIAVVEFSLPPSQSGTGGVVMADSTKELDISIIITKEGYRIVGTGKKLDLIPLERGEYQFEQLRALLKAVKFQYPSQNSVVLVFDPDVMYDNIIKFMDVCRESQFPDIGLSGDIG